MPLTSPPPAPLRSDPPATFIAKADAFVAWFSTHVTEMNAAIAFFNLKGVWVSGTTYTAFTDVVISPINYKSYIRKITGAGTTDPSIDTTNWQAAPYAQSGVNSDMTQANALQSINGGAISGFRNLLLNGDMRIDQLLETTAGNLVGTNLMAADAWWVAKQTGGATAAVQNLSNAGVLLPGFERRLRINVTAAAAPAAGDFNTMYQRIEGSTVQHLQFGTANAKTVTLGFWVLSGVTGTFAGSLNNGVVDRSYVFNYTINAANTWEFKTVTIPGDTAGTWAKDNTSGMQVQFDLGSGSTQETATVNAWQAGVFYRTAASVKIINNVTTFSITGVQLEIGNVASTFETRDFASELARCQRFYEKSFRAGTVPAQNAGVGDISTITQIVAASTGAYYKTASYAVRKRAVPTVTLFNPSAANAQVRNFVTGTDFTATATSSIGTNEIQILATSPAASAVGNQCGIHWTADARL